MSQKDKRKKAIYVIVVSLYMIWFFFFLGDNGPYLMRDSYAFIQGRHTGVIHYGLYIIFIRICRLVFGRDIYLYAIFIIQSIFACISSAIIVEYLKRVYKFSYIFGVLLYVLSSLPYTYSLPENIVSHHILTEGISISLFYLFFFFILRLLLEDRVRIKNISGTMVLAVLEALTRPHLALLIPISIYVIIISIWKNREKRVDSVVLCSKIGFALIVAVLCFSPLLVQGVLKVSSPGSQTVDALTGRIFSLAEEEDGNNLGDGIKELYISVFENESEAGHLRTSYGKEDRYVDDIVYHTNEINKNLVSVISKNFAKYTAYCEGNELTPTALRKELMYTVICNHKGEFLIDSLILMEKSLVASVFIQPDRIYILCHIIAIMLHVIGISNFIYGLCNRKVDEIYLWPFMITYILLLSNVVSTNLIMFGIQRYVIYTQGLFYIALFIMVTGIRKAIYER